MALSQASMRNRKVLDRSPDRVCRTPQFKACALALWLRLMAAASSRNRQGPGLPSQRFQVVCCNAPKVGREALQSGAFARFGTQQRGCLLQRSRTAPPCFFQHCQRQRQRQRRFVQRKLSSASRPRRANPRRVCRKLRSLHAPRARPCRLL